MRPVYLVTERFTSADKGWQRYVAWSGLSQLTEVVSLDQMLCPTVLTTVLDKDWPHIVSEDFMLNYFRDLDYLLQRVGSLEGRNLLCVFRNPNSQPLPPAGLKHSFVFEGYDLVEFDTGTSALTNCGGFPLAFSNAELSSRGLLPSLGRATEVQNKLRQHYPDEPHASCEAWAVFRANPLPCMNP
jgi:hypothetical protein